MTRKLLLGLAAMIALAAPLDAQTLRVGDPAPPITDLNWLKGEPVKEYQADQVYVLDFWATWCGPCIASIPHINELQQRHAEDGVHVIAIAVWPREGMKDTGEFVAKKGDEMGYRVAEDIGEKISTSYLMASGQQGIPTVMVIDQAGTIAWIGHPMGGLDEVVKKVVAKEFDAVAMAKETEEAAKKQREHEEKARPLLDDMRRAWSDEDWPATTAAVDALLAFDDGMFAEMGVYKYIALVKDEKSDEAARWGTQLVSTLYADNANMLNSFSWQIVGPATMFEDDEIDAEFAVLVAKRASDLTDNKDPNVLDTLARAYFVKGDTTEAIKFQKIAIEFTDIPAMKTNLESRLTEYEEAVSGS